MIKQLIVAGAVACLLAACGSSEEAPAAEDAAAPAASEAAAGEGAASAEEGAAAPEGVESVSFNLSNATSRTLVHLYISPADTESWNRDILGDAVVAPGASGQVSIDDGVESCMYDFRGDFDNGQAIDVRGINVCEIEGRTVTISE